MVKNSEVGVQSPENVEIEGKIESIQLKRLNKLKYAAYVFLCIITGGLMYLMSLWFIKLKMSLTLSDAELEDADKIIITGAGKLFFICLSVLLFLEVK